MEIQFDNDGAPFVEWGGNVIRLEKEPLTEEGLVERAREDLRETPELRMQALQQLRTLLKGETSLLLPIDNDEFLLKFLRPCKFYADSAYKRIQSYYKFRLSYKEYCRDLMPSAIRCAFDHSVVSVLAPRDQHGRRIMLVESGDRWNHREVPLSEVFRGVQLGLEAAMVEPRTQVCGVLVILDMKGLSFSQVMQFTPSFAKMTVDWIQGLSRAETYSKMERASTEALGTPVHRRNANFNGNLLQDCVPIRLKAIHIVNQPYIFNMLFAIFKPFLREKLRRRIHFHGNDKESLLSHVAAKALRARHGGSLPDPEIPGRVQWQMLRHYEDDFKLANSYGYVNNNNK